MDLSAKIASEVTIFGKYARYIPELKRRETWDEIVLRYQQMMVRKYCGELKTHKEQELFISIEEACDAVRRKEILPSMRGLQFAGPAIERNNSRIYNCSFVCASDISFFRECMFLLLGGTGVGYSVQERHISQLPPITAPGKPKKYLVSDSIEGWGDAVKVLVRAFFKGTFLPRFDFSDIRPKGERLITAGGKAPGPGPLRICLDKLLGLLESKAVGERLSSVEVSDMACFIADAVLAGGIRRAAMICLFDIDDADMLAYKSPVKIHMDVVDYFPKTKEHQISFERYGKLESAKISEWEFNEYGKTGCLQWWTVFPERARVNVSAVAFRHDVFEVTKRHSETGEPLEWVEAKKTTEEQFKQFWKATEESRSGEPGIYWTNHPDWGTNPCCEIALRHKQFCNLTTINFGTVRSQADLNRRARHAAILGTLQAGFVDMHYLGGDWEQNCREEALLGVSITGIGDNPNYREFDFEEAARITKETNVEISKAIGINQAARITCIKPEGSSSLVLGTSSGVHGRHAPYYIRRFRHNSNEAIIGYLARVIPNLVVPNKSEPGGLILELPQKSPEGSITRMETALETLERLKFFRENWVEHGHISGLNTHNISTTVSVRDEEWESVGKWLWENRAFYNGIAVLPFDGGTYSQAPFEDCSKEVYEEMMKHVVNIDLREVTEDDDATNHAGEIACAGGQCSI